MKVYIAGPMRGIPDYNRNAFKAAKTKIEGEGHEVLNPHDYWKAEQFDDYDLKIVAASDINMLSRCDSIYMLEGWEKSIGSRAEHACAIWMELKVFYEA